MKSQCLGLVAAFLEGGLVRCLPAIALALASLAPDWSSVKSWLLRMRPGRMFSLELSLVSYPVLHLLAPVRRGAVADARLGLACPKYINTSGSCE